MDRMRGRADRFRDFLSDTCCTCLSSVPSFALVVLAIVLVMLLIATIPLVFALTYWHPQGQHLVTSVRTSHPAREHDVFFDNSSEYVKVPPMIKSSDFLPFKVNSCRGFGFSCTNTPSEVIGTNQRCDGNSDCGDNSDETNCHRKCQTPVSCKKNGHRVCLRGYQICDKKQDCDDGFDEGEHCTRESCTDDEYRCNNSTICIPRTWMCDGDQHCPLGDDETECKKCQSNSKLCASSSKCIPKWEVCNGNADCDDFSDEMDCDCKTCSANGNVLCNGERKMCLPIDKVCDGVANCPDGEDEHNCPGTCAADSDSWKVNEDRDVIFDDLFTECGELGFNCTRKNNVTGSFCIPRVQVCDGKKDCSDGSDEFDCGCAHKSNFKCSAFDGKCIRSGQRCDGFRDCEDGSDEENCKQCNSGFFCKADKKCIKNNSICDGRSDCSDGEDEKSCSCKACQNQPFKMYYCSGSPRCFRIDEVCDPYSKCPNATERDKLFCAVRKTKGILLL